MHPLTILIEHHGIYFNTGEVVTGCVHVKSSKRINVMQLKLTVKVVEEIKIYKQNGVAKIHHTFYNAPYVLARDFSLNEQEEKKFDFEVVLPLDRPGTYHGYNCQCKWLLIATVFYGNNQKIEKFVEIFVQSNIFY